MASSSASLTYPQLIDRLFPRLTGGVHWGLERTQRLLAAAGDPHLQFHSLHVGGTNGKGSVAAHAASILAHGGHRVGLYTSPHLCTFRERIEIDGVPIAEAALLVAAARLWPYIEAEQASFFEATTAIAFRAFADVGVAWAVVEVGLGGRLDATNVIAPAVTLLTNVSLDHVQLLGPTIEAVAGEKAGIIKTGVPVVSGATHGVAAAVLRARAAAVAAPWLPLPARSVRVLTATTEGTEFAVRTDSWGDLRLRTPLLGQHQALNAALAVRAIDVLPADGRPDADAVRAGVAAVRWPGRLQRESIAGVDWCFDVAHNVAGMETLVLALERLGVPAPITAVIGVLGDKDWRAMLGPLYRLAQSVLLVEPPTAPADRRWDAVAALAAAPAPHATVERDFGRALARAHEQAVRSGGSVLVTGSFHTVGDALIMLRRCQFGADAVLPPAPFAA